MFSVLNPFLFLRRNPSKAAPVVMVIMIAVTLVASVVTIVRSINLTISTLYGYNQYVTGITPRNNLTVDPDVMAQIKKVPGLGEMMGAHSYTLQIRTIFGRMMFPLFGMDEAHRAIMLERCGVRLVAGRAPREGQPEAIISSDVARNMGFKLGDFVCTPESEDNYAPVPVKIVGLLEGKVWIALTSKSFVDENSPITGSGYLLVAKQGYSQEKLDSDIEKVIDKSRARAWTYEGLLKATQSALVNLYLILNIVVGTIVVSIAFVCGLLSNIYFTQRLPEVATLSAIGYPRKDLLRRAVGETILFCAIGWSLGVILTVCFMKAIQIVFLTPKGLLLNPFDPQALVFTIPLPFMVSGVAWLTLGVRLSRLDPVSIIERRA